MKKSIFSKIFLMNIAIVMVGVLILAVLEYTLISKYIYRERLDTLKDNANAIASFIDSGSSFERLENFLYGFSRSTNKNILIIDKKCRILLASTDSDIYNGAAEYVDLKYCSDVLSNKEHIEEGTLGNIYKTEMFTLQIPIINNANRQVVGAVFISTAAPEMLRMQFQISRIMGLCLLLVVFVSFVFSFALSRGISEPIKRIGSTAKKFAKGDFSSRVEIDEKGYNIMEVSELAETFNDMAYDLEQADNIRNNFISDVSHELRTPMTTIAGFVDGILDETIPPEKQRDYLVIVKDEISRLSGLVNSFLDITRLKNGKLSLEMVDFDINEVIRRTLINFESRIDGKNINVDVEFENESCYVKADVDSIKRVLTNLLDNAIKFTDEGGRIAVKVYGRQQEVCVSVYNTGCGIAGNELKFIFERFYKVDRSRSVNREGTGIGLYIVKDILNQHGKDIRVKSSEGEYAEFTFTLDKGKRPNSEHNTL